MNINIADILAILDQCCDNSTFPMLDNGYVYLADTRLSLYRSTTDWAMVIEVFGFSPRMGLPDTHIYTFASRLYERDRRENYVSQDAFENYLANHPHNESRFIFPIEFGPWQDCADGELVSDTAENVVVRGDIVPLPVLKDYGHHGIELEEAPRVHVFELCRYLSEVVREKVLASPEEQRISVRPEMGQLLLLDEWHHPNVVADERPSQSKTFQQLAQVLVSGDVRPYRPTQMPNTHWRNWPAGGRL